MRNQRDENHLAGDGLTLSNSSNVVTFDKANTAGSALGCAGITVSTIASWMRVVNQNTKEKYFIPMWK